MKKSNFKFLLTYLKKYLPLLAISILCAIVSSLLTLLVPYIVGKSIDLLLGKNLVDMEKIVQNCLIILIATVGICFTQYFASIINTKICFSMTRDLRRDLNNKIHTLPLKYLDNQPVGQVVNRIISDVEVISDGLIMGFNQLFSSIVTIIACLTIMLCMNYKIALVVILLTPLPLFVARFISKSTYSLFKKQSVIKAKQTGFINEMITNEKVVQTFQMEKENNAKLQGMNNELEKVGIKAVFFSSIVNPTTRFINALIYAGVALTGAMLCLSPDPIKVGVLSTFLFYVNHYTKPFNEITEVIAELQNSFATTSRVKELLEEKEEVADGNYVLQKAEGDFDIDHVYFQYTEEVPLITDFCLNVKKGTKVAIVGPTGCGKTTLINLLMRFYDPKSGSISIDGHKINEVTRHSLRNNYGMVLQETWLKETSIKDNVKMGKQDATDEEVIKALEECHCMTFVNQLEDGINTIVKEDGGGLSQGQKQLLCVSRIMLTHPPLLILDEATSSIDTRTEIKIQEAFNKLMEGKTSFIVAHRLSTIKNADIILVMNNGNIIEMGNHNQLLEKKCFYYNLYNSQFKLD